MKCQEGIMTRVIISIENVRLANAKVIAGAVTDISRHPASVQRAIKDVQSSLPQKISEAARRVMMENDLAQA